ncbi:MAG: metal-dependent transcriptional regulator [Clostridiales Family XIII bacterium]|nr:metal-dependent transcriptional regulator [Clostridiales Family XIII bacterium]
MHESGENYLETILILQKEKGSVRSIDVATELNYSKPSISRAMGILKKAGYITIDDAGNIHLTESGRTLSEDIYERHQMIAQFFVDALNVERSIALQDACRIEHVISAESFTQIKRWLQENGAASKARQAEQA